VCVGLTLESHNHPPSFCLQYNHPIPTFKGFAL
jgi:hypothetical protein